MNVTVSCAGRFHAYDLSRQLENHHMLSKLITTYPVRETKKFGIPENKVASFLTWEVFFRGWSKACDLIGKNSELLKPFWNGLYDKYASLNIPPQTNVFIGWSSKSEISFHKARKMGAKTIVERGSAHILTQTELLNEEYKRHSVNRTMFTHPKVIEKEMREYELADFISVPSSFAKRSFLERGFRSEKIVQNPYGVDISQFTPGDKKDNVFRVIYVGQLSLAKGVHYLLQAFHALKLPASELVLIGSLTEEIKPFLTKYNAGIRYLGVMPRAELVKYYQQASVFCIASIQEGLAMVQAQAMACGLPLICTYHTGGEDLIDHGTEGFVIPIRDVEAIKEKLDWMYSHPMETKQMGVAARRRILNGFTWKDYGDRYVRFLRTLEAI